ncbi:MAG: sugar phosphate isomerase/epimerase [Clostridia bacterium]|nr:sugar phosphate isomerase/epimerase [Clostridia bacterium]
MCYNNFKLVAERVTDMRIGRIQNNYTAAGFDLVKNTNLEFIEICCNNQAEAEKFIANKDNIKAEIARTGIDVSCVGRWNHDINVGGKIDADRLNAYFAQLDAAIELGAKTFVCGCNYADEVSLYKNYTVALDFLGQLTERAKASGSGIKIAIQNCHWNNFIDSPEQWKVILGENPDLWLKYDASHAYNRNADYLAEMSDYGEKIAHFHVKGTTHAGSRAVSDPPAGMDDLHWGSIFSILYARGYDGDLSIEPHSKTWQGELGAAGVEFTRQFISKFVLK